MKEGWMDRGRKSLRMTGGGPVSGTTTNTVEISEERGQGGDPLPLKCHTEPADIDLCFTGSAPTPAKTWQIAPYLTPN